MKQTAASETEARHPARNARWSRLLMGGLVASALALPGGLGPSVGTPPAAAAGAASYSIPVDHAADYKEELEGSTMGSASISNADWIPGSGELITITARYDRPLEPCEALNGEPFLAGGRSLKISWHDATLKSFSPSSVDGDGRVDAGNGSVEWKSHLDRNLSGVRLPSHAFGGGQVFTAVFEAPRRIQGKEYDPPRVYFEGHALRPIEGGENCRSGYRFDRIWGTADLGDPKETGWGNLPVPAFDVVPDKKDPAAFAFVNRSTDKETPFAQLRFVWQFGDGTMSMEANPTHRYAATGTYKVILLVRDTANDYAEISKYVKAVVHPTPPVVTKHPSSAKVWAGSTFTAESKASGAPTPTVKWQRREGSRWIDIPKATTTKLKITVKKTTKFRAVFFNASGTAISKTATATAKLKKLTAKKPKVTGSAKAGKTLKAKPGAWGPKPVKFSYQWLRSGKKISGATKSSYKVKLKDRGKKISVKVTGKKTYYKTASKTSAAKKISTK